MSSPLSASDKIYVDQSGIDGAGRGVFARTDVEAGEVIEVCPVLALDSRLVTWGLRLTRLRNYFYQWGAERQTAAFALGFGSLYNHTYEPNAVYEKQLEDNTIKFTARKSIRKGEEITINYNGHPEDMRVLWDESISNPDQSDVDAAAAR